MPSAKTAVTLEDLREVFATRDVFLHAACDVAPDTANPFVVALRWAEPGMNLPVVDQLDLRQDLLEKFKDDVPHYKPAILSAFADELEELAAKGSD
jgi:hypothetical protein